MGRELIIRCHVQLYTPAFRDRKAEKLLLCLADFCLFWAGTGYPLPLAALYTLFSESKKRQKIFAAQTPQRKRGYVEDFALNMDFRTSITFTSVTALLLRYVHVAYGKIAARQARGWGWFLSNGLSNTVQLLCHVTLRSA